MAPMIARLHCLHACRDPARTCRRRALRARLRHLDRTAGAGPAGHRTGRTRGWPTGGAAASASLLPHIHALLAQARLAWPTWTPSPSAAAPGAFTGLRTACAVAQGLGLGLARPLLPIDSLLIVAEDARAQAAAEAPRVRRRRGDGCPHGRGLCRPLPLARRALAGAAGAGLVQLAGVGRSLVRRARAGAGRLGAGGVRAAPGACRRAARAWRAERDRAGALLRLALLAARRARASTRQRRLPLYLRDKVALTTSEREAARAGGDGMNALLHPHPGAAP